MIFKKADILLAEKRLDFPPALDELYHYHCCYDRLEFWVPSFGVSFIQYSVTCTWFRKVLIQGRYILSERCDVLHLFLGVHSVPLNGVHLKSPITLTQMIWPGSI